MSRLLKRPLAEEDLLDIWLYIAQDNPITADAWVEHLGDAAWRLAENPGMGRLRPELLQNIRSFPVGDYILFYQEFENGIELIRVLSACRDLEHLL
ncbi:type II toxin-antitoxin system RelE/ParE family toxin [Thiolapillus sp.]